MCQISAPLTSFDLEDINHLGTDIKEFSGFPDGKVVVLSLLVKEIVVKNFPRETLPFDD